MLPQHKVNDSIDRLIEEWDPVALAGEASALAVSGRLQRLALYIEGGLERIARRHDITRRDIVLLLALRRAKDPLTPTMLLDEAWITSGAMARRLDLLETRGLVVRKPRRADGRSVGVHLTARGRRLVDNEVRSFAEPEHRVIADFPAQKAVHLIVLLRELLANMEATGDLAQQRGNIA